MANSPSAKRLFWVGPARARGSPLPPPARALGTSCHTLVIPFTKSHPTPSSPGRKSVSLVIPPGYGSAAFTFTGPVGTQPFIFTLGVDISDFGGDHVFAANLVKASFASAFATEVSSSLTLDRVTLAVGQDGPGGSVDSNTAPDTFSRSGSFPPTAMSCIVRKVTNELGRRGRGRMFIPGIVSENEVDEDGSIVPARQTAIQGVLDTWYENLAYGATELSLQPVLFHSAAPTMPTEITAFAVSDLVGWVRGRIR